LYSGNLPKAPGTWGSIAALIIFLIPNEYRTSITLILLIFFFLISIPLIDSYEKENGDDNSKIVIDEVLGMWLISFMPVMEQNIYWILIGLFLFRFFDISKPFPISVLNSKKGAIYVILDDILAAIYTIIVIFCLNKLYFLYILYRAI
jgi:phosphatidylglycerophosphatase A